MEVYYETGETITEHNRKTQLLPQKYKPLWFGLQDTDRNDLYRRIDRRVETMLELGLMDEINNLLASGIPEKCTAMQAIGYKEFIAAIHGECTIEAAKQQVQQASRHYAKRQLTWFRRNPDIHWLNRDAGDGLAEILLKASAFLTDFDN